MREALLLSHENHTLRAALPNSDDALTFTFTHNTWLSEDWEPVQITFAWGHGSTRNVPSENECICSKTLALQCLSLARTTAVMQIH
jgi:hypothetical protein